MGLSFGGGGRLVYLGSQRIALAVVSFSAIARGGVGGFGTAVLYDCEEENLGRRINCYCSLYGPLEF